MAILPLRFIVKRLAQAAAAEAGRRALGPLVDPVVDRVREELGIDDLAEAGEQNIEEALDQLFQRDEISERQLRRAEEALMQERGQPMVDFNAFMSIGLNRCGNDQRTFKALTELWNRNKQDIQSMSRRELRDNLRCP